MSKSTNRYGKIQFHATAAIDANPEPSARLKRQWKDLDEASRKKYGKQYDALTGKEKTALHFDLNAAREKKKEKEDLADVA